MPTLDEVYEALEMVIDPELGYNVVELGLIYEVRIEGSKVYVKMTFTTPACPYGPYLAKNVEEVVKEVEGVEDVDVHVVFEPLWSLDRIDSKLRDKLGLEGVV